MLQYAFKNKAFYFLNTPGYQNPHQEHRHMWKEVLQLSEVSTFKSSCILSGLGDKRHYQEVA